MTTSPEWVLWLDLETTGSDEDADPILEVGAVLCQNDAAMAEVERFDYVLGQPASFWDSFNGLAPVVRDMHEANGLWRDVRASSWRAEDVDEEMAAIIREITGSTNHVALAGSGVAHFDRRFIHRQLPRLDKRLTYWAYDVGVVRRFIETVPRHAHLVTDRPRPETKAHRALADARDHRDEWLWYASHLEALSL